MDGTKEARKVADKLRPLVYGVALWPESECLLPTLDTMLKRLEATIDQLTHLDARFCAQSRRLSALDRQMARTQTALRKEVDRETGKDPEHPIARIFSANAGVASLLAGMRPKDEEALPSLVMLLRTDARLAAFAHHADALERHGQLIRRAERMRDELNTPKLDAWMELSHARDDASRILRKLEGALLDLFEGDQERVESLLG